MSQHRPYAHVAPGQGAERRRWPRASAPELWVAVLVAAVVSAFAVPGVLAFLDVGGWPTAWPVATGLGAGLTVYHLGVLTVIALAPDR